MEGKSTECGIHRVEETVAVLLCCESVVDTVKLRVSRLEGFREWKIRIIGVRVNWLWGVSLRVGPPEKYILVAKA
jgi:hypothetical protein